MILRLLSLCLAIVALAACGEPAEPLSGSPALWVIEGNGGEPEGWLFGTVHALPRDVHWDGPALDQAMASANTLVVEVRGLSDEAAIGRIFSRLATDTPQPPLLDRVDPDRRSGLDRLVDRAGADRAGLDRMETWAAALALARSASTGSTSEGVDRELERRFADRPVVELEGAKRQLSVFDSLPESEQRDLLSAVIDESLSADGRNDILIRAWLTGDLSTLGRETRQGMLADPELYEALVDERNRAWADRIAELITKGDRPFVAVGAGHMLGRDGLPALLKERGYTIRRLQ